MWIVWDWGRCLFVQCVCVHDGVNEATVTCLLHTVWFLSTGNLLFPACRSQCMTFHPLSKFLSKSNNLACFLMQYILLSWKEQDSQEKEEHKVLCLMSALSWYCNHIALMKGPSKNGSLVAGTRGSYVTYCFNGIQQMQPYSLRRLGLISPIFIFQASMANGRKERMREHFSRTLNVSYVTIHLASWLALIEHRYEGFFLFHSLHNNYNIEWEMAPALSSGILSTNRFTCTCLLGQGGCGLPAFPLKVVAVFFPFPVTNQPKSSACEEVSPF